MANTPSYSDMKASAAAAEPAAPEAPRYLRGHGQEPKPDFVTSDGRAILVGDDMEAYNIQKLATSTDPTMKSIYQQELNDLEKLQQKYLTPATEKTFRDLASTAATGVRGGTPDPKLADAIYHANRQDWLESIDQDRKTGGTTLKAHVDLTKHVYFRQGEDVEALDSEQQVTIKRGQNGTFDVQPVGKFSTADQRLNWGAGFGMR